MTNLTRTHKFRNIEESYSNNLLSIREAFADTMVGRRITHLGDDYLVLDDGTRLDLYIDSDCCAVGSVDAFRSIRNLEQATITRVEEVRTSSASEEDDEYNDTYRITLFGGDKTIAELDHTTDYSNGYYCSAVDVNVVKRPQYTAIELDESPQYTCFWDETGIVWQKYESYWYPAAQSSSFVNPINAGVVKFAFKTPEDWR